jgi:hypothetical protein
MEWLILVLILALPVLRFMLLPARVAIGVRRLPLSQFALIGAGLVAGWFVLDAVSHTREPTGQYLRGEAEIRKLLE